MSPEDHRRVRRLFDEALERPEAERIRYLESACRGDMGVFQQVLRLLQARRESNSFLADETQSGRHIGRYLVTRELGRGAMGIVYEAVDPLIGRSVAVKTIYLQALSGPSDLEFMRDRLFREARSAGALFHPGIVVVFDVGQEGDTAFIAMERVDGQSLQQMMVSGPKIGRAAALDILREAADALDYAHRNGIIHRDIKPANIMLHHGRTVKIADFGIAKMTSTEHHTRTGMLVGTPSYMSPEQIEGKTLDGRADQFSLAVVAYELLTGVRPFEADSLAPLVHMIVYGERPSARAADPTLPAAMDAVLERGLRKLAAERYPTCTEFVAALEAALKSAQVPATVVAFPAALMTAAPAPSARATSQTSQTKYYLFGIVGMLALITLMFVALGPAKRAIAPAALPTETASAEIAPAPPHSTPAPPPVVRRTEAPAPSPIVVQKAIVDKTTEPPPLAPVIADFTADLATIRPGQDVKLQWSVTGVVSGTSLAPGGPVPNSASGFVVRPAGTTVYTLTARGVHTSVEKSLKIEVNPYAAPVITQFSAQPRSVAPGQSARLTWETSGDIGKTTLTPGPPINPGDRFVMVAPQRTTEYTLETTGPAGSVSRALIVEVAKRIEPAAPPAVSKVDSDGEARRIFAEAQAQLGARKYDEAAVLFGRAARLAPAWSEPWIERAKLDAKLGRFPDAIEDCNQTLRLNPNNAIALNLRGFARYSLNQVKEAVADFDAAIRIKPDSGDAYQNRGNAKWKLNDRQGAEADFKVARSLQGAGQTR